MQVLCGLQGIFLLFNCQTPGKGKHIFSHVEWHMEGVRIFLEHPVSIEDFQWVRKKDVENVYALPSAFEIFRKLL